MLVELKLEQYIETFEEEEMTSMELLEDIVNRGDGEKVRDCRVRLLCVTAACGKLSLALSLCWVLNAAFCARQELMDALKEMGIKKMGHRQAIVGAVVGKL